MVLIVLLVLFPIFFNLKKVLGIGYSYENKNYNISFSEGTGGINLEFTVEHKGAYDNLGTITIQTTSSGNVEPIGIAYLKYSIKKDSTTAAYIENNKIPPVNFYSRSHRIYHINTDDHVSCSGEVDVIFNVNGLNHTQKINFEIVFLIKIGNDEIYYNWELPLIWINIIYYIIIFVVIFLIVRFYKTMKHESWYTEEERKKDEKFFEKIKRGGDIDEKN